MYFVNGEADHSFSKKEGYKVYIFIFNRQKTFECFILIEFVVVLDIFILRPFFKKFFILFLIFSYIFRRGMLYGIFDPRFQKSSNSFTGSIFVPIFHNCQMFYQINIVKRILVGLDDKT